MKTSILLPVFILLFISCSSNQEDPLSGKSETDSHPIQTYLEESGDSYRYEEVSVIDGDNYTAYVLRMVSGTWQVTDTEWWHYLTIVVPEDVHHTTALVYIGGGSKHNSVPETANGIALETALKTGSVTAYLHNIPFQPEIFKGDPSAKERTEDDLIAYGWRQFMENGAGDDHTVWLSRLPMTRAVVRAMDTITDFSHRRLNHDIETYVVTGASKRGWTAWTTGIFDDRVIAIAPAVIDLLNIEPSFLHHWKALGEWSPAIQDYTNENIMDWLDTPEFNRLVQLTDPYSYLEDFDKPVFLLNAASDEFFLPDSWQFYWDDLPDTKALRYVPNSGHSIGSADAITSLTSFYQHITAEMELPRFDWAVSDSGITIQYDIQNMPDELLLWNAHNPAARDFRLYVIDRIWLARSIEADPSGTTFIPIEEPSSGFTAWFAEAVFYNDSFEPFTVTSGVKIVPDIYLHDDFEPDPRFINRTLSETNSLISE